MSDHLQPDQLTELRNSLESRRREILGDIGQHRRHREAAEKAFDVGDDLDAAERERERELELQLTRQDALELREVEAALRRMDDGDYGICEESGDPIPFPRLKAIPTARYTVAIQAEIEREQELIRLGELDVENAQYTHFSAVAEDERSLAGSELDEADN